MLALCIFRNKSWKEYMPVTGEMENANAVVTEEIAMSIYKRAVSLFFFFEINIITGPFLKSRESKYGIVSMVQRRKRKIEESAT